MRWGVIIPEWLDLLEADSVMQQILGSNPMALYESGERDQEIPSLEWTLLTPGPHLENWESPLVQLDMWTRSDADRWTLANAVYRVLHHDGSIETANYRLRSEQIGGGSISSRDGVRALRLDYRLTYLRARYAA